MMKTAVLKPRISEKGYALSEQRNTYIFSVPKGVNKFDVAKSVASQYEVKVVSVRLAGVPGKAKKVYRDRGRKSIQGKRSDLRKAYVVHVEGHTLPIFAAVEEPEAPKENK